MGSPLTESNVNIMPNGVQPCGEPVPRLVCRKMPLESNAFTDPRQEAVVGSVLNFGNPSPPGLNASNCSPATSFPIASINIKQESIPPCPREFLRRQHVPCPESAGAFSCAEPPRLTLVEFENRFTRMVINMDRVVRGAPARGFAKFMTCNRDRASQCWQENTKQSNLAVKKTETPDPNFPQELKIENKEYVDMNREKRCKRFLRGKACDGSCGKWHKLPKEDGVKCVSKLHGQCQNGRRCNFLHDDSDSDSDDESFGASASSAIGVLAKSAKDASRRNIDASVSTSLRGQNEASTSKSRPSFPVKNSHSLSLISLSYSSCDSTDFSSQPVSSASSSIKLSPVDTNCGHPTPTASSSIHSSVKVENSGRLTAATSSDCAESSVSRTRLPSQDQNSISVKLEPSVNERTCESPVIPGPSLKREHEPELVVSKKSKLSPSHVKRQENGHNLGASPSTSNPVHSGSAVKYEPPEPVPLFKEDIGHPLVTPQDSKVETKASSALTQISDTVIKKEGATELSIKVPESYISSSEDLLIEVSDSIVQILKEKGEWRALGLQSSDSYSALFEYLISRNVAVLSAVCVPKRVVWDVHIRLAFIALRGGDPRCYLENIEMHLATESLKDYLDRLLKTVQPSHNATSGT